jgi:hypothetical protein
MRSLLGVFGLSILIAALWVYVLHAASPEAEQPASRPLPTHSALCVALNDPSHGLMATPDLEAIKDAECPGRRVNDETHERPAR